jgi:hypothetical protein
VDEELGAEKAKMEEEKEEEAETMVSVPLRPVRNANLRHPGQLAGAN